MSKKNNSSKNSFYEERIKSCFSKKNPRAVDNTPYEQPYQKYSKSKIQSKKTNTAQKKEIKERTTIQSEQRTKTLEESENKGSSSGTQRTIIQDCAKQVEANIFPAKEQQTSPERRYESTEELIKNCNLAPLKTLICEKLNDCDFFSGEENIRNSSKRLLFMEYKNKELYINKSREKSRVKEKVIPKDIQHAFQNVKSPKNYFSINSRIPTEQTYDTSDPSNCSKMTPPGLTPRSNEKRSSFTFAPLNIQEIEKDQENPNVYYAPHSYYYYGGFCHHQSVDYSSESQKIRNHEGESKNYNIDVNNIESDGRTTLMIKNIPNKYTREMLIQLFDRTHKKKYDFLYLPIDPENSCNIGYAFINFLSCSYIKQFYEKFDGQKWERYNSEKICRLTYARMQGTSSLVEHVEITTPKHRKIKNFDEMNISNLSTILQKQRQWKCQ